MTPSREIGLVVRRELRRNLRSAKGIALGVLTLLGAFVSALVCTSIEGSKRELAGDAAASRGPVPRKRGAAAE